MSEFVLRPYPMAHFGDACIHCGTPHDEIKPGPCQGDPEKAIPVATVHRHRDEEDAFLIQSVRRENGGLFIYFEDGSRFSGKRLACRRIDQRKEQ